MMQHISVRPQNCHALRDGFKAVREEGIIKAIRQRFSINAIIRHEQRECYIGIALSCLYDGTGSKMIEVSIFPDNEICHTIFGDMPLDDG